MFSVLLLLQQISERIKIILCPSVHLYFAMEPSDISWNRHYPQSNFSSNNADMQAFLFNLYVAKRVVITVMGCREKPHAGIYRITMTDWNFIASLLRFWTWHILSKYLIFVAQFVP